MNAVVRSRLWWLVLAVFAGTVLLVAGCSSENSPTAPSSSSDPIAAADKAKPTSFTGDIVVAPNIHIAPWDLQGLKKAKSFHETGTGPATFEDVTAADFQITWSTVEGYNALEPLTEIAKLKFNSTLVFDMIYMPVKATALTEFGQSFEDLLAVPYWMAGDGWYVYGNVYDGETFLYGHGPWPAPNNLEGSAWCDIVTEQGGEPQELQQLAVFSDYANTDHGLGYLIESNLFQEQGIAAAGTWYFSFDAKAGNLEGSSTAAAFIKVLDPHDGYAMTHFITQDTTSLPVEWYRYEISIEVTADMAGDILQFGFMNTASNYEGSGVFYDNVLFQQTSTLP